LNQLSRAFFNAAGGNFPAVGSLTPRASLSCFPLDANSVVVGVAQILPTVYANGRDGEAHIEELPQANAFSLAQIVPTTG